MTTDEPTEPDADVHIDQAFAKYDTPQFRARMAVTNGVSRIVARTHGPDGFVTTPMYDGDPWSARQPRPEQAIRATLLLRSTVDAVLCQQITDGRSNGASWEQIAHLLGIDADKDGVSPAEQAFYVVAPDQPSSYHPSTASWRCGTCHKLIIDRGPFENHPTDNESGHAADCNRHPTDIQKYEQVRHSW